MNPQPELESDTLRSEIDTTRERMDETIDALGNRLEGRHLVDELIGFFRGRANGAGELKERLSHSAGTAVHSVVDAVKAHPIPVVLTSAGLAWLIYEMRSGRRGPADGSNEFDYSEYAQMGEMGVTDDSISYPSGGGDYEESEDEGLRAEMSRGAEHAKGKLADVGARAKEKASAVAHRGREALGATKERLSGMTSQAQQRGREAYQRTRERVVTTTHQHPLEVGLACLAAGAIIGLMLPTPQVVNRRLGPSVDRLRDRARGAGSELLQKGKRVVEAAASAAKVEAKTQGITVPRGRNDDETPSAVGQSSTAVAGSPGTGPAGV
jgi:ElaB/YqjD/DUF883 family membrane-anchored ribosome-binding protein